MWHARSRGTNNITSAVVKDFFNLSLDAPVVNTSTKHRPKNRIVSANDNTHEIGQSFKLTKNLTENDESNGPNLPSQDDYTELFHDINTQDESGNVAMNVDEEPHIFENYSFDHTYSDDLPITQFHKEVIETIETNSVTVIQGATGSGKTTQVPQYILDHYVKDKRYCNIIVTQPRRIAAISIAKRVCDERSWDMGGLVGYQVARNRTISDDTRISYVTTGVLLQKLISDKSLNKYTHIILDEVHERDQETDFTLLVVRKLLRTNSKHVKVILMSATLDSGMFSRYFSLPINGKLESAPVVTVEGRSYPVQEYYLNDIITAVRKRSIPLLDPGAPEISEEQFHTAACLVGELDSWEKAEQGMGEGGFANHRGTVLVFLPGLHEIKEMDAILDDVCRDRYLWILPLHSLITNEEQSKVFKNPPKPEQGKPRYRKIILATNIAESSITVPDIKYVIDFCLVKCLVCDSETNYQSLRLQYTSHASATQRKGRAGRVSSGQCFRMVPKEFYEKCMQPYSVPELKRCPLEQIVLKVKLLDLGAPKAILGLALQPPDVKDIERTILVLKEVGALTIKMHNGIVNSYDGDLTFVGRVIGSLPVDIRIGKLLVLGHVFGVLEEALVIGACLSLKSFFAQPFKQELNAYRWKMQWSRLSHSDCLASLNAYKEWKYLKETGGFGRKKEHGWCKEKFIQLHRIREVEELVKELELRLQTFNIRTSRGVHQRRSDSTQHDELILKIVICGSFYPNYFTSGEIDEKEALKTLSGHDPSTTVMVKGIPAHGQHYSNALARIFRPCGVGKNLYFEGSRAYIEFERPERDQFRTLPAVYLAIKMRYLQMPLSLYIAEHGQQQQQLLERNQAQMNAYSQSTFLRTDRITANLQRSSKQRQVGGTTPELELPEVGYIEVYVSEVINAGHFWAQLGDRESATKLRQLMENINSNRSLEPAPSYIPEGTICLALFPEDEKFYRAKVLKWQDGAVEVIYLDYGNIEEIPVQFIRKIRDCDLQLPFQAFECHLCDVRAVYGEWDREANERFKELTMDKKLVARIYSRLHGSLRIDLWDTTSEDDIHINQILIIEGFGQYIEESYDSVRAHDDAAARNEVRNSVGDLPDNTQVEELPDFPEEPQSWNESTATKVQLNGPYSPYEMSFYSMTCIGRLRASKIERNSVNSVALNGEPQDKHDRFLVAANIGINTSGNIMVARETTLMPNIHGLPALVGLVFAPCAELRTDPEKTRYTGAIIGLGSEENTDEALLPDHDIELTFDFVFTTQDLAKINSVRRAINIAVGSQESVAEWGTGAVQKIQHNSRDVLLKLVLGGREDRRMAPSTHAYKWNQIDRNDLLTPYRQGELQDDKPILYPLHYAVPVTETNNVDIIPERVLRLREHVRLLHQKAGGSVQAFPEAVVCQLCTVRCRHPRGLMLHLETRVHKSEARLLFDDRYVIHS